MTDQSRKILAASFATPDGGSRGGGALGGAFPDKVGNVAVLHVKPDDKPKFVESLLAVQSGSSPAEASVLAGGSIGALASKLRDSDFKNDQLEQLGKSLGPNSSAVVAEIAADALPTAQDVDTNVAGLFDDEEDPTPEPEPAAAASQ
jgi:hypothetical protein